MASNEQLNQERKGLSLCFANLHFSLLGLINPLKEALPEDAEAIEIAFKKFDDSMTRLDSQIGRSIAKITNQ